MIIIRTIMIISVVFILYTLGWQANVLILYMIKECTSQKYIDLFAINGTLNT